ncbi:MAG: dienelactone hydrolase family protein [Anaerolineae bacterium]|jgi:carboxymethylenebutenolidase|nr:dienelactone hydrolase family protein [Anaerolineae bacterium]
MTYRIRRFFLGLLALLALLVTGLFGLMLYDTQAGEQAADVATVTFPAADGTPVAAVLARPEGPGPFPGVLMVHEWWGLNAEIAEMAAILAQEGYVVLAPDTYRGRVAATVPGALALRITVPADRVDSDMQAAFAYLAAQPDVLPEQIAVMGFCYGGGVALRHAVQNPQIAATINLYGDTISDPAGFGALLENDRPVLGIFGEVDRQIPVAEAEAFAAALAAAGIPGSVTIYPGMPHAFVTPHSIAEPGEAQNAWRAILAFLAEQVPGTPAGG